MARRSETNKYNNTRTAANKNANDTSNARLCERSENTCLTQRKKTKALPAPLSTRNRNMFCAPGLPCASFACLKFPCWFQAPLHKSISMRTSLANLILQGEQGYSKAGMSQ